MPQCLSPFLFQGSLRWSLLVNNTLLRVTQFWFRPVFSAFLILILRTLHTFCLILVPLCDMGVLVLPVHNFKRSVVYNLSSIINDKWSLTVLSVFIQNLLLSLTRSVRHTCGVTYWSRFLCTMFSFFHEWLGLVTVDHAAPLDLLHKGSIMFELSRTFTGSPITLAE